MLRLLIGTLVGLAIAGPATAQFSGSDDFSSTSSSWTPLNFNAALTPVDGSLVYTTGAPTPNDSSGWYWNQNYGSLDADWMLQVDVAMSSAAAVWPTNLNLVVANITDADPYGNIFRVHLRQGAFYVDFFSQRTFINATFAPTSSLSATLGISYDADTQVMSALYDADGATNGYDFTSFYSASVATWSFGNGTPFEAFLYAQTGDLLVTPGMISFDNFSAQTVSPIPEPETYAMLVAGLALLGFARRRSKTMAAA